MKKITTAPRSETPRELPAASAIPSVSMQAVADAMERAMRDSALDRQWMLEKIEQLIAEVTQRRDIPRPDKPVEPPRDVQIDIERDKNGNMKTLHIVRSR